MKSLIILLFTFFSTYNTNAQTESETIDFLNSMLSTYTSPMTSNTAYYKISTAIDQDSKSKIIIFDYYVSNGFKATYKFHPIHVNAVTTFRAPNGNLCLKIISPKSVIKTTYNDETEKYSYGNFIQMAMSGNDEDIYRIQKGIMHLLKLNNSKLVDNNLFKD